MLSKKMSTLVSNLETSFKVNLKTKQGLEERKADIENKISDLNIDLLNKTAVVLQKLSENQRDLAKHRLEELGTQALKYSMGENYKMILDIDTTRKRAQTFLYVVNEKTGLQTDPLEENGGGIVDIISIALQLMSLQAQTPMIDGPVILDEPFKMVSKEYIPLLSEFLKKISKDFGRQNIIITHNEYLIESCDSRISIG